MFATTVGILRLSSSATRKLMTQRTASLSSTSSPTTSSRSSTAKGRPERAASGIGMRPADRFPSSMSIASLPGFASASASLSTVSASTASGEHSRFSPGF